MEASIKHLVDSDLRHERVSASSPQAAVGLRAVNASCWPASARRPSATIVSGAHFMQTA